MYVMMYVPQGSRYVFFLSDLSKPLYWYYYDF